MVESKEKPRLKDIIAALGLILGMLAIVFVLSFKHNEKRASTERTIESDRLELYLRLADALTSAQNGYLPNAANVPNSFEAQTKSQLYLEAKNLLLAYEGEKNLDALTIAELTVISHEMGGEEYKKWLDRLATENTLQAKSLREALGFLYNQDQFPANQVETQLKGNFPPGWYQDKTLLAFYKLTDNQVQYKLLQATLREKGQSFLSKFMTVFALGCLVVLVGIIAILIYLILAFNKESHSTPDLPIAAPNYGWPAIYKVFAAWLATQIVVAIVLQSFAGVIHLKDGPILAKASATALLYVMSNFPALLYIYFFALKPKGIKLLDGIKLNLSRSHFKLPRLIACGILAWVVAVPIVLIAYLIAAKFFNAHGSSNPIIVMVTEAAHTANFPAILVFYLTVSVLAPICEESLFRGFLYTFLRGLFGVMPSMLISAGLFAAVHLDPGGMVPLFCLGSLFAYLVEKTNTLLPSIIAHGLWNGVTFTLVLVLFSN